MSLLRRHVQTLEARGDADLLRRQGALLLEQIRQHHPRALCGEQSRRRLAGAPGRAGHDGHLAVHTSHA